MTVNHAITWAHMTALEHGGHDKMLPGLANDELRFTMASIREAFAAQVGDVAQRGEQDRQALLTTLERVRAAVFDTNLTHVEVCMAARYALGDRPGEALAGQPEAPKGQEPGDLHWHPDLLTPEQTALVKWAERAEQSAQRANARTEDLERDLSAANARIAELKAHLATQTAALAEDLAAAKAKILELGKISLGRGLRIAQLIDERNAANARADAEFERGRSVGREDVGKYSNAIGRIESALGISGAIPLEQTVKAVEMLNARAVAAERELEANALSAVRERVHFTDRIKDLETIVSTHADCRRGYAERVAGLESGRDQLAARVKELEAMVPHPGDGSCERCGFAPVTDGLCSDCTCTPEERSMLEAMGRAEISKNPRNSAALNMNRDAEQAVCQAELANRAAKAKRGGA